MPSSKIKGFLDFLLRFGISAALLWFLFTKVIDVETTMTAIKSADMGPLVIAFIIFIVLNYIVLYRWLIFIKALDLRVSFFDVHRYFFAGLFANPFLPSSIGGDIIKILGLCKTTPHKPRVVASVMLDRLSGFAGIVVVSVIAYIFAHQLINNILILALIIIMAVAASVIMLILFNEKIFEFFCRVFNRWPKIKESVMQLHYDVVLLKDKKAHGIWAILVSCCMQLTLAVVFYFTAQALHVDIKLFYFIIFVPLICVASSFPSIGGLGVRELGAAGLLSIVGVDKEISASITLINFAFMVVIGLLGGLFYVITLYTRRIQHHPSDKGLGTQEASRTA